MFIPLVSGFSPKKIKNLGLWLNAEHGVTLSSNTVTGWSDLSGNGRDAAQSNSGYRPTYVTGGSGINNRPALNFDGTDDYLYISSGLNLLRNVPGATIFAVHKLTSASTTRNIFRAESGTAGSSRANIGINFNGVIGYGAWGRRLDADPGLGVDCGDVVTDTVIQVGVFDYSNSNLYLCINGYRKKYSLSFQSDGNTSNTDSAGIGIGNIYSGGSGSTYYGLMSEIIVYTTALSWSMISSVENYLSKKYNVPMATSYVSSVRGPSLWLDAGKGITESSNKVSSWSDISGNSKNASQSNDNYKPTYVTGGGGINNLPAVSFSSSSSTLLSITTGLNWLKNASGATAFIVFKPSITIDNAVLFRTDISTAYSSRFSCGLNLATSCTYTVGGRRVDADTGYFIPSSTPITTNAVVYTGLVDFGNSDAYVYLNGTLIGSNTSFYSDGNTSNTNSYGMAVGASPGSSYYFSGLIAELIVFAYPLESSDRTSIQQYLGSKYNISIS